MAQLNEKWESALAAAEANRKARFNTSVGAAMSMLPPDVMTSIIEDVLKHLLEGDRKMFLFDLQQFGISPAHYKQEQKKIVAEFQEVEARKVQANKRRSATQRARKSKEQDERVPPMHQIVVDFDDFDVEKVVEEFSKNG